MRDHLVFAVLGLLGALSAQSNTIAGLDGALDLIEDPWYFGRRGAAHPNGEIGIAYSYYVCNRGTAQIQWQGPGNGPAPMATNHPLWAFLVARESDGRMVQITDDRTYVKHASGASNSTRCTPCQNPGTNTVLGVGCSDAYGQNTNANRFSLGPRDEIDPWLGTWNPIHSYFDRGDPDVGPPANADGVRSLSGTFSDPVKNRVTLSEQDLMVAGRFYYSMDFIVQGERADLRGDNIGYREMTPTWNGSVWSFPNAFPFAHGSVLSAWQGASVSSARNGNDDGTFYVAVVVTGPVAGLWHYEYAVHNVDNRRGAATLRIPLCPSIAVANAGFRDIDGDPLDDWTSSRVGGELVFSANTNALQWNQLFNFWFDCASAPVSGTVTLDEALPGTGALQVGVATQVPGTPTLVAVLGPGCGTPLPAVSANGAPVLANSAFGVAVVTGPLAPVILFASTSSGNQTLAPGCTQYLGGTSFETVFLVTDGAGRALFPVPVPSALLLDGQSMYWQAAQIVSGGVVLGGLTISNGLQTRVGCR